MTAIPLCFSWLRTIPHAIVTDKGCKLGQSILISASGGALGGLRGLVHVRAILGNIGVHVLPKQLAVSGATKLFNDDDSINDPDREKQLKDIGANLAQMTDKIIA